MEINFSTDKDIELVDITEMIDENISIEKGFVHLFAPHATGALLINENEEGLVKDILNKFKEIFPKGAGYKHDRIDNNAHSHLMATFVGPSLLIPVENGKMALGTWQSVFFLETDGPRRERRIQLREI